MYYTVNQLRGLGADVFVGPPAPQVDSSAAAQKAAAVRAKSQQVDQTSSIKQRSGSFSQPAPQNMYPQGYPQQGGSNYGQYVDLEDDPYGQGLSLDLGRDAAGRGEGPGLGTVLIMALTVVGSVLLIKKVAGL